jgi:hypothetical protein
MRKLLLTLFIIAGLSVAVFAQASNTAYDLEDLLNKGQVVLTANGNGGSSGSSIEGYLKNVTSRTIWVNIYISKGLYLKNSGIGQNMIAVQVYLEDGSYYSDGTQFFIELEPQENTAVTIVAFCADFEKENPSARESFTASAMPGSLRSIASKISRYLADNGDEDIVDAAQVAVWLTQGETSSSIRKKFDFASADEAMARRIINY